MVFGIIWMLCQAIWPYLLGRAVDDGIAAQQLSALWGWCIALLAIALLQAASATLRHRMAVSNSLRASLGAGRLVGHHSAETGPAITSTTASGEIISTGSTDALSLGGMFDVTARLSGGIVAYLVVSAVMLSTSRELGLVVLVGIPVLTLLLSLLIRPLQKRQAQWREQTGLLTTLGADTVSGLRVLRGIGGEDEFVARYTARSQEVRRAGVHVVRNQSWLDGLQVLLPGLFLAFIVWFGARLVLQGAISIGDLVAFFGYATFLVLPLRTAIEAAQTFSRGLVATGRLLDVLRIQPGAKDAAHTGVAPPRGAELVDVASGVVVQHGLFTGIVSAHPDEAAEVATRLGRFYDKSHEDKPVLWGGIDHTTAPIADVRERIVVMDAHPHLFAGSLLDGLDVERGRNPLHEGTETGAIRRVTKALTYAAAMETVEGLPGGLREVVAERGRSFSGGQRQRLSLARALLAEAEVLVLVEPTSAVDAHTESQIAASLREARSGHTTVVITASPLMLDRMDVIQVMRAGKVIGTGTHADLMRRESDVGDLYRSVVARTMSAGEPASDENLEDASTGSIDTLWHEAEQTGAIALPRIDDAGDDTGEEAADAAPDR